MWHLTACKYSFSLAFLNWIKNEMIFLSYLWINVGNINSEIWQKIISYFIQFKNEKLTEILQAVRCHILLLHEYLFKPSLDNKMSIFEEYGAFNLKKIMIMFIFSVLELIFRGKL